MQTIKLRQTTENNGGPCTMKSDAKGVPWVSESDVKGSWPSVNMWRVGSENVLASNTWNSRTDCSPCNGRARWETCGSICKALFKDNRHRSTTTTAIAQARRKSIPKTGMGQSTANVIQTVRQTGNPQTGNSPGEVQTKSETARQTDNPRQTNRQDEVNRLRSRHG